MSLSSGAGGPTDASPDVPFSLGGAFGSTATPGASTVAATPLTGDVVPRLVEALLADAPPEWVGMAATFSLTVERAGAIVVFATPNGNLQRTASPEAFALARAQRDRDAAGGRLWWRLTVGTQPGGRPMVDVDFGDDPFAGEFLFTPEDYRADFVAYPGRRIPVWLAAYAFHADRQHRAPQMAVSGGSRVAADDQWPELDVLWARWSAMAAVVAATSAGSGPSIAPGIGIFESPSHSGSTLVRLPGGRAVLSGGVFDAPELRAAYLGGAQLPELYAGAPLWVGDSTLNVRLESGMLSFCWWYADGHWYRAQSPDAASCAAAVPAVWHTDETARAIAGLLSDRPTGDLVHIAEAFVGAVETGTLTRTLVETLLPAVRGCDTAAALVSLSLAGHCANRDGR
ncbi:hypothetical protein ACWDTI_17675 [Gordonia sp. NPDC003424]